MKTLDSKLLKEILNRAGEELQGEWILLGGTLLPALGLDIRSTVDIDLVSLEKQGNEQSLMLMELAQAHGLPVETINQAAAFFLAKIGYTKGDLLVLTQGKKATIYRPSVELFWKLKTSRLTESDLLDCKKYFEFCRGNQDPVSTEKLSAVIEAAQKQNPSAEKAARLKELAELVK